MEELIRDAQPIEKLRKATPSQLVSEAWQRYVCECGTVFYRDPLRCTVCSTCFQVVVDIDGLTQKAFN